MKRTVTIKLTRAEADGLMDAGLRGIEDQYDADTKESQEYAIHANTALSKLGRAMGEAWPGWAEDDAKPN